MNILRSWPVAGGYSHANRAVVELRDGRVGFLKRGVDADTDRWIRDEVAMYRALKGAPWIPRVLGMSDGDTPFLFLEDLREGTWPPPWTPQSVAAVHAVVRELQQVSPPAFLNPLDLNELGGWRKIAEDPEPFLALGLVDAAWLSRTIDRLCSLETVVPGGDIVVSHFDLRSDNLVLDGNQVKLFDWNHTTLAPVGLDIAFWAPSLALEGGPAPTMPDQEDVWATRVAGFFAGRAGLPELPHAPRVRFIQKAQLDYALPWMRRVLGC